VIASLPAPLRRAVSAQTGIVRAVEECLCSPADPPLFQASCELGRESRLLGTSLDHLSGIGGVGRTRTAAASAAVAEALERYSASWVPEERLVVATARELSGTAVSPHRFALFSERQQRDPGFPFRPFTDETRLAWIDGRELPSGREVHIPAELVLLGPVSAGGERPIAHATSSGLACGEDRDATTVRALCELLERDAFMIVWASRLELPLLEPAAEGPLARDVERFASAGLRFSAVDLSCIHRFPVVLGVVRAPRGFPGALGVGAAAASTADEAWWKALSEAFSARAAGARLALVGPGDGAISSFEDHIRHHADHVNAATTAFLDASPVRRSLVSVPPLEGSDASGRLGALCRRVEAAGSNAYVVDVTSPDVAVLGLTVVRALAPELCALDVSHAHRFLGGERLYRAAADLGLRDELLGEDDVNPDPHPFP
jgi:ribosomal protein S12 methylthiotransferase accessory factor